MKILHLIAGELNGGAARGAYWLHEALIEQGIHSKILTNSQETFDDSNVISLARTSMQKLKKVGRAKLGTLPLKLYKNRESKIFSTGFEGINITSLPSYLEADIVHLHWVNGLLDMRTLKKIKKPTIWTIRDMWPMTGGCHYSMNCKEYMNRCGKCPQLNSKKKYDLSRLILLNKLNSVPEDLKVIGISEWISECAKQSAIFKKHSVKTISNNVNTKTFFPINKKRAREALGIETRKNIVLIGAQNVTDFYKGFDLFIEALDYLDDCHFVFFGKTSEEQINRANIEYTNLGFLTDIISLRLVYSAADLFVAPSRMEAFGKTIAEAMSCETPVVSFNATGPKDIIQHKVSGYKAVPFDPIDLAEGIKWVLALPQTDYNILSKNARQRIVEKFGSDIIAREYINLYKEVLI